MREILIVGAGQAGLQTAIGLQREGYAVTLINDRSPEQIKSGPILSTQCMFNSALETERAIGINYWDNQSPEISAIQFELYAPQGHRVFEWRGDLDRTAMSIDQRVKFPKLIETFCQLGGKFEVRQMSTAQLIALRDDYDLILISTGKFEDKLRARWYQQGAIKRMLSVVYVNGLRLKEGSDSVRFHVFPGEGELFVMPCLTLDGPASILFWEAIPGSPLDVFSAELTPQQRLQMSLKLINDRCPGLIEDISKIELADQNATLVGAVRPRLRSPIFELGDGRSALGMADAVVLNDPIMGQGANSAAKCASIYVREIIAHGERVFTNDWKQQTFDHFWAEARVVTDWTNAMLSDPPPHVVNLLAAAATSPSLANKIANGFDDPQIFERFFFDAKATSALIERSQMKCTPTKA